MIKVNLLPPEYRVKERTPLPMLLGIFGGVALSSLSVFGFLYIHIGWLQVVNGILKTKEDNRNTAMKQARKYDELDRELKQLEVLNKAVEQLKEKRFPWTKAIDDLAWMVERAKKSKSDVHGWYESLDFSIEEMQGRRAGGAQGPQATMDFDLLVAGRQMSHMGHFRDVLKKEGDFISKNILKTSPINIDEKQYRDYQPDHALHDKITLNLSPTPVVTSPAQTPGPEEAAQPPGGEGAAGDSGDGSKGN